MLLLVCSRTICSRQPVVCICRSNIACINKPFGTLCAFCILRGCVSEEPTDAWLRAARNRSDPVGWKSHASHGIHVVRTVGIQSVQPAGIKRWVRVTFSGSRFKFGFDLSTHLLVFNKETQIDLSPYLQFFSRNQQSFNHFPLFSGVYRRFIDLNPYPFSVETLRDRGSRLKCCDLRLRNCRFCLYLDKKRCHRQQSAGNLCNNTSVLRHKYCNCPPADTVRRD